MGPCIAPRYKLRGDHSRTPPRPEDQKEECSGSPDPEDQKSPIRGSDPWRTGGDRVCRVVSIEWDASNTNSQPCGRIVVCSGDGIHNTPADALGYTIAKLGGGRVGRLHDAPPRWRSTVTLPQDHRLASGFNANLRAFVLLLARSGHLRSSSSRQLLTDFVDKVANMRRMSRESNPGGAFFESMLRAGASL